MEVLFLLDRVSEGWNTLVYNKGVRYNGHSCQPSSPIKLENNITNCYGLHESGCVTVVMCVIEHRGGVGLCFISCLATNISHFSDLHNAVDDYYCNSCKPQHSKTHLKDGLLL